MAVAKTSLAKILQQGPASWLGGTGPEADIALSSRVRLARNVDGIPFPHVADAAQATRVLELADEATTELNRFGHFGRLELFHLQGMTRIERQALVERHLISPQLARCAELAAVALRDDEAISIMVNEEDHFRLQIITSGLQLQQAHELAGRMDNVMEKRVRYAFNERHGYLTSCPTNVGTGLRASVMMHLPALVSAGAMGRLVNAMNKVGVAIRGFYGEGTEPVGNVLQVSNQITLGQKEEDIISNLEAVTRQIIAQERQARRELLQHSRERLTDRVGRALGILRHAHILPTGEAMQHLSDVRLGVDLGLTDVGRAVIDQLWIGIRPASLQLAAGRELSSEERDVRRAAVCRRDLQAGTR